jgi:hypothetical protein
MLNFNTANKLLYISNYAGLFLFILCPDYVFGIFM